MAPGGVVEALYVVRHGDGQLDGFPGLMVQSSICIDPQNDSINVPTGCRRSVIGSAQPTSRRSSLGIDRIPHPFTDADRRAGYTWELSMRQVKVSRTLVFDDPRRARSFFEALVSDKSASVAPQRSLSSSRARSVVRRSTPIGSGSSPPAPRSGSTSPTSSRG